MATPLRVLVVEDSEVDTMLILRELRRSGFEPVSERVETTEAMTAALDGHSWDLIISDYALPQFGGAAALSLFQQRGLDIPFIIVSGALGEERAVEMMKAGAHDYVLKHNLARLSPAATANWLPPRKGALAVNKKPPWPIWLLLLNPARMLSSERLWTAS